MTSLFNVLLLLIPLLLGPLGIQFGERIRLEHVGLLGKTKLLSKLLYPRNFVNRLVS
jgi:hypothetical protein